ncbi:GlxA family transcriptional regulator [Streptomyces odontomachi]|uniref:GlxA family transcriptional regulator n=1 Tax=Streptomyces odontomachi TaxID=2944940 RepID=UPI00210C8845|nr:helix-turn-helix domain-containing protein [Streptomyces sp. ODS25]
MPKSVALAISDGIPLLEVAAPCEIFGTKRRGLADSWYDFTVCGSHTAQIGGWFQAGRARPLSALAEADTVIVPACRSVVDGPSKELVDAVRAAHAAGARIVSICTGAFVLAAAGLLRGRRATTHWMHTDLLAARHPEVQVDRDVLYVDEGDVLTSAGKAAGLDLCLHIVRLDYGAAVANGLARILVMPPHRDGGQAQFVAPAAPRGQSAALGELLHWATARLDEPLTVPDLARHARMSTRTLNRRFTAATGMTPLQWLLSQRIYHAQQLLETTDHSIEQIAAQTGMGTATTLRRHFNRTVGVPPDTYRRTFRAGVLRQGNGVPRQGNGASRPGA